jgi:enoyl-CoA hydratase/carnithine racemase
VIPAAGFEARVRLLAGEWAAQPTRAVAETQRLLEAAHDASLDDQLAREAEAQARAVSTEDFGEGVAAFLEKRPPGFTGR